MNGKFSFSALKKAADQAYKEGDFVEATALYSKILRDCAITDQETNTIKGNRCLSAQKAGKVSSVNFDCLTQEGQPFVPVLLL